MAEAITWMEKHLPSFVYLDKGIKADEQSAILIKKGNFYGMGYVNDEKLLNDINILEQKLEPYQDNDYIRNLVFKHAATYPERCIAF
jgi:DNA polymerase-3 subunit epsilon